MGIRLKEWVIDKWRKRKKRAREREGRWKMVDFLNDYGDKYGSGRLDMEETGSVFKVNLIDWKW